MSDSPMKRPPQLDSPSVGKGVEYAARAQVWCYHRTNGRIGGRRRVMAGSRRPVPVLLLDHVDGRSAKRFTTPLPYLEDGADLVVVAAQGGLARNPQWFVDLEADPDVQVQVGAQLRLVRARVADPGERAALRSRLVELYADFESYQGWADHEIPVVVLEPR